MVRAIFLFLALAYTGAVTYLSLIDLSGKNLGSSDKLLHLGAYFVMALLWMLFFVFNGKKGKFTKKIIYICVLTILFGIFIEALQGGLTSYRTFDIYDALANGIGAIAAGIVAWLLKKKINQVKNYI